MSKLFTSGMWVLFLAGLTGCVGASHLVHGTQHQHVATYGGLALSLVAGGYVFSREPLKSFLKRRAVMWFLFLFNLSVAVAALLFIHGSQGLMTAGGMGLVSLGAGAGLLTSRRGGRDHGDHGKLSDDYTQLYRRPHVDDEAAAVTRPLPPR